MDCDVVGALECVFEGDHFDADSLCAGFGEERVVREDFHTESHCALCDFRADSAHTQNRKGLVFKFRAFKGFSVPLAVVQRGVCLRNRTRSAENVRERKFRRRDCIARGGVHHDNALFGSGGNVDIVDADARAAYRLELLGASQNIGGDVGFGTDDDCVRIGYELFHLFGSRAVGFYCFEALLFE